MKAAVLCGLVSMAIVVACGGGEDGGNGGGSAGSGASATAGDGAGADGSGGDGAGADGSGGVAIGGTGTGGGSAGDASGGNAVGGGNGLDCLGNNADCELPVDCCSGVCTDGTCTGDGVDVTCAAVGAACGGAGDSPCCSGQCGPDGTCTSNLAQCTPAGSSCNSPTECCNLRCEAGQCANASACVSDGEACTSDGECCGQNCGDDNTCAPLNFSCKTAGNACGGNSECCSQLCQGGKCALGSSFCVQTGDICSADGDCCTAKCNKDDGATVGTCAQPPSGPANCSGVEGSVCNGCGECCSRLCAPYRDTGVFVCQPASGCRVTGDLCREDTDCCGAEGTGLPGDGNVQCVKGAGEALGICRNPMGCTPQGNVCHFKNYACSISSASNSCCSGTGFSDNLVCKPSDPKFGDPAGTLRCAEQDDPTGTGHICSQGQEEGGKCNACALDRTGVPRCDATGGVEGRCRAGGETCSSSLDCCEGLPCIPDGDGVLRCLTGGGECVQSGDTCTVDGDCCRGLYCNKEVGSTQGVCLPPDGGGGSGSGGAGTGGAGGSGGTTGGSGGTTGGSGGSTGGSGGSTGGAPACAAYGQQCDLAGDCCSGVPCIGGFCVFGIQ